MASLWTLHLQTISLQPSSSIPKHMASSTVLERSRHYGWNFTHTHLHWNWSRHSLGRNFLIRVSDGLPTPDSDNINAQADEVEVQADDSPARVNANDPLAKLHHMISSSPSLVYLMNKYSGGNLAIGLCIAAACFAIIMRIYVVRNSRHSHPGSVADLVRRGQLRSDRRGISRPLKYEDPFNNPLVKVGKSKLTVEVCGKIYRLAPVTLTEEEQAIHQKRRSRAYQWKRPSIFLKEGDSIPPDVDPDTIRWIPANHPFATTASDIDENLAQSNVYQKHGVPFRIQAEHEALQRKLEALQSEEKLNKLVVDPSDAKDSERPFKIKQRPEDQAEGSYNQSDDS